MTDASTLAQEVLDRVREDEDRQVRAALFRGDRQVVIVPPAIMLGPYALPLAPPYIKLLWPVCMPVVEDA